MAPGSGRPRDLTAATGHHFLAGSSSPLIGRIRATSVRRRSGGGSPRWRRTLLPHAGDSDDGRVDRSTRATDDDPRPFILRAMDGRAPWVRVQDGQDGLGYRDAAHPDPDAGSARGHPFVATRRARDARRDETRRARDDRRDASTHDPYDYKRPGARRDDRGRGWSTRESAVEVEVEVEAATAADDDAIARATRTPHDRNRAGHERVDRGDEDREEGEVSGGGGRAWNSRRTRGCGAARLRARRVDRRAISRSSVARGRFERAHR